MLPAAWRNYLARMCLMCLARMCLSRIYLSRNYRVRMVPSRKAVPLTRRPLLPVCRPSLPPAQRLAPPPSGPGATPSVSGGDRVERRSASTPPDPRAERGGVLLLPLGQARQTVPPPRRPSLPVRPPLLPPVQRLAPSPSGPGATPFISGGDRVERRSASTPPEV